MRVKTNTDGLVMSKRMRRFKDSPRSLAIATRQVVPYSQLDTQGKKKLGEEKGSVSEM